MDAVTVSGGWEVLESGGRWMARHPRYGWLQDRVDGCYAAQYETEAELLAHLTGAPVREATA